MQNGTQIALDASIIRKGRDPDAGRLPRRSRTKQGKARLLTLDCLDMRTAAAQTARKLITDLIADLGGADRLSAGETQLVTRAALVGAIIADHEARWVAGEAIALADYTSLVNVQRRCLVTLGLERRAKDIGPTLADLRRLDLQRQREREREQTS